MNTTHRLIDGMLLSTLTTCQPIKRFFDIVHQRLIVKIFIALTIQFLKMLQLFNIAHTHIRS